MKKDVLLISIVVITLFFSFYTSPSFGDRIDSSLEMITDIDASYFLKNPKLPWLNDPFLREPGFVSTKGEKEEQFNLGGILFSKNQPMAIINGKTVKIGDQIGDRTISSIGENFVVLKKHSSEIEIGLAPVTDDVDEDEDSVKATDEESE